MQGARAHGHTNLMAFCAVAAMTARSGGNTDSVHAAAQGARE